MGFGSVQVMRITRETVPPTSKAHNGLLSQFVAAFTAEPNNRQQGVSRLTSRRSPNVDACEMLSAGAEEAPALAGAAANCT